MWTNRDRLLRAGALAVLLLQIGCSDGAEAQGTDDTDTQAWPAGTTDQRIGQLADHIGGFSPAMIEVGYRYNELYFAGEERNWDLAAYHASKIADAIEAGIERRPARAASARIFLERELSGMESAIEARDHMLFRQQFERLTHGCNACHRREGVPFIAIRQPERRLYPWSTP